MFSVLLAYPDYLSDGLKTYYTSTPGPSIDEAIHQARLECIDVNSWTDMGEITQYPEDFRVLLVIAGEHDDLKFQATVDQE